MLEVYWDDVARAIPHGADAIDVRRPGRHRVHGRRGRAGLASYDRDRIHHFELTKAAVEDVFRTLATEPLADRVHNPGLERERADVIVGGCCVLVSIMRTFGFDACLVSEADILDGLIRSQLHAEGVAVGCRPTG